ncbi:MAG TPA: response regulator, partial [Desulfotignum sp.]|nr:response regulator [Desulfotignum sp.]
MTQQAAKIMVVGGGISGISASLELARSGCQVLLVEHADHLGGLLSQLDRQFPDSGCGMCRLLPLFNRDQTSDHCLRRGLFHENIEVCLGTDLVSVEGETGSFSVALKQQAARVDPSLCIGCGRCEAVCPVVVPDPFNAGLTSRKAVYRPCPQSFSYAYTIDPYACNDCRACQDACPTGAITFAAKERETFHVLVVDDEKIVRDSMKEWLAEEGYQVWTAASAKKALDLMADTTFHMMLTDIKMPGMDGVELLARAKALQPDLDVVMMTAYAAVDSAVEAMKQGALEYVIKPFEPETVLAMVSNCFAAFSAAKARMETVDAMILAQGNGLFAPDVKTNPYGYRHIPGVVTSLEFERMLSHAGLGLDTLVHPTTGQPVQRIAWFQCVGSRDLQYGNAFCSSFCCMASVKQAMLAKTLYPQVTDARVFYMDLRTSGKGYDRYADQARQAGVTFVRSRVHSLAPDTTDSGAGIRVVWADKAAKTCEQHFDLVVLAVGVQPEDAVSYFAENNGIAMDASGFVQTDPLYPAHTSRSGIFACGGLTGPKDIHESIVLASAAAMSAMEAAGMTDGQLPEKKPPAKPVAIAREVPRIMVAICRCNTILPDALDTAALTHELRLDPEVAAVAVTDRLCREAGRDDMIARVEKTGANRLVVASCAFCVKKQQQQKMAVLADLPTPCVAGVDVITRIIAAAQKDAAAKNGPAAENNAAAGKKMMAVQPMVRQIRTGISRVKTMPLAPGKGGDLFSRALVVGGGIAGMTAALAIADRGFAVDLVEKSSHLGGNLVWLHPGSKDLTDFFEDQKAAVLGHDRIRVHTRTCVHSTKGRPGQWETRLATAGSADEDRSLHKDDAKKGNATLSDSSKGPSSIDQVRHGVVVLAVGGTQADPGMATCETGPGIYTQQGFQQALDNKAIDITAPVRVAMIQCWGSRQKDRNFCSRVCCPRSLEQALLLKNQNPDSQVHVFYRDMMTPGLLETLYTQARQAGVLFFPYEKQNPPSLSSDDNGCRITWSDAILDRSMETAVDYVVLATGVTPDLPFDLAQTFGADLDRFGFFAQADSKWRPVEALDPRVLACGLALEPGSMASSLAAARAAAARAVAILSREKMQPGTDMARVRNAYCRLCELCISACPFGARHVDHQARMLVIDPLACQGCGICAAV